MSPVRLSRQYFDITSTFRDRGFWDCQAAAGISSGNLKTAVYIGDIGSPEKAYLGLENQRRYICILNMALKAVLQWGGGMNLK